MLEVFRGDIFQRPHECDPCYISKFDLSEQQIERHFQLFSLCLVAGRRPDLLRRTLTSFNEMVFTKSPPVVVRVNIDPIFGNDEDEAACIGMTKEMFPNAKVRTPETPNFCRAVKWLWSEVPDGLVLHLEDDWVCNERVHIDVVEDWMKTTVKSVPLLSVTHGKKGLKEYSESRTRKKYFGLRLGRRRIIPSFGTSPGFFDGAFLRKIAPLLNEALDPEKQMKPVINPALFAEMDPYKVKFYKSSTDEPIIVDIGREWRDARSIEKQLFADGRSVWIDTQQQDGNDR